MIHKAEIGIAVAILIIFLILFLGAMRFIQAMADLRADVVKLKLELDDCKDEKDELDVHKNEPEWWEWEEVKQGKE